MPSRHLQALDDLFARALDDPAVGPDAMRCAAVPEKAARATASLVPPSDFTRLSDAYAAQLGQLTAVIVPRLQRIAAALQAVLDRAAVLLRR